MQYPGLQESLRPTRQPAVCRRGLVLLVWGLALSLLPVELDALRIGRTYYIVGPTLGDHVANALNAAGNLRREKAVLSAQISVARKRYYGEARRPSERKRS